MTALRTLLRLLFPSWAFFDRAGASPVLEVRAVVATAPKRTTAQPAMWQPAVCPPTRRWWHLLFNAGGTLALAEQTLVERWHAELEDDEELSVTRALVERLAAASLQRDASGDDAEWEYRLRVDTTEPAGALAGPATPVARNLIQRTIPRTPRP